MDSARRNLLLAIAGLLAALQFLVVPWFAAQSEAHQRLEVLTARLVRSEAVLQNKQAIKTAERTLTEAAAKTTDRFARFASVEAFKLESQPKIVAVAVANGLTVSSFSWLIDGKVEGSGLQFARARVQWSGNIRAIAAAHAQLETGFPNLFVRDVSIAGASGGPGVNTADTTGSIAFVIDLYFRGPP